MTDALGEISGRMKSNGRFGRFARWLIHYGRLLAEDWMADALREISGRMKSTTGTLR